ncbi:MAG: adenylate/guanylate cyclase domain-containing protein [Treponema sp.]|nr:adenylate/guanylate cyclase domain-containing protein [Treponema sp.]
MASEKQKILLRSVVISGCCFVAIVLLNLTSIFTGLENKTYDGRMKNTASTVSRSDDIIFIAVDQDSIDWAQKELGWGWPWPRSAYADIVDFISAGKVNSIAFDIFFTEPSIYGPEDDLRFAQAEKNSGKVIQTLFVEKDAYGEESILLPIDVIRDNAAIIANVTSKKDKDDIIRRVRLSYQFEGKEYPNLGFAPILLNKENLPELPLLDDNTLLLRYQKTTNIYNPYRASDILQSAYAWKNGETTGLYTPEDFDDFYVFVGYYAPGLFDICSTPVSQVFPGVGVHITTIDNVLNNSFVKKLPGFVQILWIFFLCLFTGFFMALAERNRSQTKIVVSIIICFIASCLLAVIVPYVLFIPGFFLQMIPGIFGFLSTFLVSLGFSYAVEGRQKRFIKSAFGQYLSPTVIEQLIAEPEKLKLGGERREISIYFSDIQGFTSISEHIPPEKLIGILNKYLSEMSDIILKHGGTIDKYEGDAIVAFWNAPLEEENHAFRIISAAMECQKRLSELRSEFEQLCGKKLYQRIGINTGFAVVGNMGSQNRFDYTMIGDSVNLASRLEGLNKQFGTYILCTEATKNAAVKYGADLEWRKIANVAVVGKNEPVIVYEPLEKNAETEKLKKTIFEDFDGAWELFYAGKFNLALKIFEKHSKEDIVCEKYAEKCRELISNPPANWEGKWVATLK